MTECHFARLALWVHEDRQDRHFAQLTVWGGTALFSAFLGKAAKAAKTATSRN
jgi:hypothetical protein